MGAIVTIAPTVRSTSILLACGLLLSATALSQEVLEEIVVTAQKRETTLQSEPLAVSAFSGEEIARAGGEDANVLGYVVPNLHVGEETNRDGLSITIRGVSGTDVRNAADPTTAFHVDGSYVPRLSGPQAYFYDVEADRGPARTAGNAVWAQQHSRGREPRYAQTGLRRFRRGGRGHGRRLRPGPVQRRAQSTTVRSGGGAHRLDVERPRRLPRERAFGRRR